MKITRKFNYPGDDPGPEQVARSFQLLDQDLDALFRAVNNTNFRTIENGAVPENVDGRYLIYTSNAAADTNDVLNHKLGRVPTGLIQVEVPVAVAGTPNAGVVYFGSVAPTAGTVTLRCTTASKRCCVLLI